MSNTISIAKLEQNLTFFSKMYDVVRLVDPVQKSVLEYRGSDVKATDQICFDYWQRGSICDNCISIRAYMDNKCYQKLDQSQEACMLVTALPLENAAEPTILELLKDASDTMLIGHGIYSDGQLMHSYIAQMNDMIVRDQPTGLYNRRYANERLPADVVKATLDSQPLSVIFIDVDNLKSINDLYGHSTGDQAIIKVAKAISDCTRSVSDWVARYGGDEFVVCLNNTGSDSAHQIADRICQRITSIEAMPGEGVITISAGVYTLEVGAQITADELIARADKRMYEAKHQGRNRVISN